MVGVYIEFAIMCYVRNYSVLWELRYVISEVISPSLVILMILISMWCRAALEHSVTVSLKH